MGRLAGTTKLLGLGAAICCLAPAGSAMARAPKPPSFGTPVRFDGAGGGTEPRVAIAGDGRRFAITNAESERRAIVYGSVDGGRSWRRTASTFGGQTSATIDTDIAVTRTGRIVATELDAGALAFVTGYSDDGGRTWAPSEGISLADQDRPWLAVGPDDPATGKPRVYVLFHNLASGGAQHEMFVSTSKDGGATFGPPVPIASPGSQAYLDLQCADSGAPSALVVNQTTGRLYAAFGTRTSALGGCGAAVFGTPEGNVVGETRVWVATSSDGSAGSWTDALAADAGDKTVSSSFETAALDREGNLYVAYAETEHPYPDFSRAAIKYVWARSDAARWSSPRVLVPAGPVGHYDPSLVAGDRGQLALAYYEGVPRGTAAPAWYVRAARVSGATTTRPLVSESSVSSIPAYAETANAMGGSCASGPFANLQNGIVCDRASDDWGLATDSRCRLTVVFPTVANDAPGARAGTYAATQSGGSTVCGARTGRRPRLRLVLRYRRDRRGCARGPVRASVRGRDRRLVRRVAFYVGRRRVSVDRRAPFAKVVDRSRHRGKVHRHVVSARVRLRDGRRIRLTRRFRACGRLPA